MSKLEIQHIHKSFEDNPALTDVSFTMASGEILALLGPSGCGKSTLLGIIGGLLAADSGFVLRNGEDIGTIPPHQRGFGFMFQDFALFPHLNVGKNVAFGLEMANQPQEKIKERLGEVLALVNLSGYEGRDVNTLSGGEQQRVALARSLAPSPDLLMLDEPLGALDRALRERLMGELRTILKAAGQTAIYVTHDQEEAFSVADRIVLLDSGRVAQTGTPQVIYAQPASPFVARFLGMSNLFIGEVVKEGAKYTLHSPFGAFAIPQTKAGQVEFLLRPNAIEMCEENEGHVLTGEVQTVSFRGGFSQVGFDVNGHALQFTFPAGDEVPAIGEKMRLVFDPSEAIRIFEK